AEIQAGVINSFPNVPQFRWHLSLIHGHRGVLLASTGRPKEAEPLLRQAFQLQRALAASFPATALYRKTLSETCALLGRVLNETGRAEEGLALNEQLVKDFPTAP